MNSTKEKGLPEKFNIIRGLPVSVIFKKEVIEEVMDYVPHDGDIIIATYPKTGTTWMQYIVQQILTKGEDFPDFGDMMGKVIPFLEMAGVAALDGVTKKPRVYKHHLPYNMVKKNPNAKIIYVYRKPDDTFISYFHFMDCIVGPLDFEQYFEGFLSGNITYGRYFEHILSFLEYKHEPNLLLVSYEKLKVNTKEEILRIAKFIGQEYYDAIASDENIMSKIVEQTSFDYMKKNLSTTMPKDPTKDDFLKDGPHKEIVFFRKGTIGDGKKSLPEDKLNKIRELAKDIMKGTDILEEWYGN